MKPSFLVVTAAQRAGTTALCSAIGASGPFWNFGEIFHHDPDRAGSFTAWARKRGLQWGDLAEYEAATTITDEYLRHLQDKADPQIPLIDIKFNSWTTLTNAWTYPNQTPFLLQHMCDLKAAFLFIRRRSLTEQVLSEYVARAIGKWHEATSADAENASPVEVHPREVGDITRHIIESEKLILKKIWSSNLPVAPFAYEDLYDGEQINPDVWTFLSNSFGVDVPAKQTAISANRNIDKRAIISNYDALKDVIQQIEITCSRWPI